MHGSVDFLISCRAVICVRVCLLRSCCTEVKINYFLWLSELPATRNWCSLGAAFGGSFGMGRGCRTRLRLKRSSPFPAHSLIALGPHSANRSHSIRMALDVALFYRGSFVVILGMCLGTLKCCRTGVSVYDDLEMW